VRDISILLILTIQKTLYIAYHVYRDITIKNQVVFSMKIARNVKVALT